MLFYKCVCTCTSVHVYYISAKLCLYEVVHVMPVTWHIAKLIYRHTDAPERYYTHHSICSICF